MPGLTILIGLLLIGQGLFAYFVLSEPDAEGHRSITAMIPAFLGGPLLLLGLVALKPSVRKHAMHIAMLLALLGILGALFRPIRATIAGTGVDWMSTPVLMQVTMAVICVVFLVLGVRSFVVARRKAK